MTKSDMRLDAKWTDIFVALALLSRIPVPKSAHDPARTQAAIWAYPLAGLVLGAISALIGTIVYCLGATPGITAASVLTTQILITGAMHEDGLADTADGLWGGWTREKRLEIMKDSHIGTYGVLALGLSLILRWTALTTLIATGHLWIAVLAAAVTSRVPVVAIMNLLEHARSGGLSQTVGRASKASFAIALVIGLAVCALLTGVAVIPLFIILCGVTLAVISLASAKIGGQTGDILGAAQQVSEIAVLVVLASMVI